MISEGLHEDDLDGVLIPVISIDEYHGKIDDLSMVISFFLTDPNAANDLSSFIESGPYNIMDSDVSKSINEDGYYQVFVEMERISHFFYDLQDIVNDLKSLIGNQKWLFMSPKTKGNAIPFTKENIKRYVQYKPSEEAKTEHEQTMDEEVMEFLSHTDVKNVKLGNGKLMIEGKHSSATTGFVTFSDMKLLCHILDLHHKPINESTETKMAVKKLSEILGPDCLVETAGQFILVSSSIYPSKVLLLK
jgi:hypothetical protein